MIKSKLAALLEEHEDFKQYPYKCTAGARTVGIGRNLDAIGIRYSEALIMLRNDIDECIKDLHHVFSDFDFLPENIQIVLGDMRFQLGSKGFIGFRLMIRAVKNRDWPEMIRQMKDSAWYGQTQRRANNLMRMVRDVM